MSDFEVPPVAVTRVLDDSAREFPDRVAISYFGNRITYRALKAAVDSFAGSLAGLGVGPMTRVAVVLPDCPQHVVSLFAVLRLGAVVVNCDPLATVDELAVQLADTGAAVVVCLDRITDEVLSMQAQTPVRSVVATSLADGLSGFGRARLELPFPSARARRRQFVAPEPLAPSALPYRELVRAGAPAHQAAVEPGEDLAVLQFTGGMAVEPRAVMLSHTNLVAAAHQIRRWIAETEDEEITRQPRPLCRVEGLTQYLLPTMLTGGYVTLAPQGEPDDDVPVDGGAGPAWPELAGLPLSCARVRIVDPEDPRTDLPIGEPGELAINGPQVFLGYWRREADVAPPTVNGWWLTGDLAVMDADGWFSIIGRKGYAVEPAGDVMRGSAP